MKFVAFISYRQLEPDRQWAKWLHASLERYRVPKRLVESQALPRQLGRVFRDELELAASPDLNANIREALQDSEFLIVVCSPRTPTSRWVNAEVEHFRELGRGDRILALLVEGEPGESFPQSLRETHPSLPEPQLCEPLAADVRASPAESQRARNRDAKLRLIAAILGCRFDDLRQREQERRMRNLTYLAGVLVLILTLLCGLAAWAEMNRRTAVAQRDRALRNQSLFLAGLANQETDRGDATLGILLSLEALPRNPDRPDRPHVPEAEDSLHRSIYARRELAVLTPPGLITSALFSPQGDRMLLITDDGLALAWNCSAKSSARVLNPDGPLVTTALFIRDGSRFVTIANTGLAQLWDAANNSVVAVLGAPDSPVRRISVDPHGKYILTAPDAGPPRLWDSHSGEAQAVLGSSPCWINTFAPDGSRVATCSVDGRVRLWETRSGRELVAYQHAGPISQATFSSDGNRILTASMTEVQLWDLGSQQTLGRNRGGPFLLQAFLSPDGKHVLSASMTGMIRSWLPDSTSPPVEFGHPWKIIQHLAPSPDGTRVVSASKLEGSWLWDSSNGKLLASLGQQRFVSDGMFSPIGDRFVTNGGAARLWDTNSGRELAILRHDAPTTGSNVTFGPLGSIDSSIFSPDGSLLVTTSKDGTARVWNSNDGSPVAVLRGHAGPVRYAVVSPDGSRVFTTSEDRTGRLWNLRNTAELEPLGTSESPIRAIELHPLGNGLASLSEDGNARIWPTDRSRQPTLLTGPSAPLRKMEFSRDGTRILAVAGDRTARIWSASNGEQVAIFKGHEKAVGSARFSFDGTQVLTLSEDRTVRLWEVTTSRELFSLPHEGEIMDAIFSPDGKRIATLANGLGEKPNIYVPTAYLWDAITGQSIATLRGPNDYIFRNVFSPNGSLVLTASQNGVNRLWNAATGKPIHELAGHADAAKDPAFSPDGRLILTVGYDRVARLWDTASGKVAAVLRQELGVTHASFTPDGKRVITLTAETGAPILWDAASGKQVATYAGQGPSADEIHFSPDNLQLFTYSSRDGIVRLWDLESGLFRATLCQERVKQIVPGVNGSDLWILAEDGTVRRFPLFRSIRELIEHARAVLPRGLTAEDRKRCFLE